MKVLQIQLRKSSTKHKSKGNEDHIRTEKKGRITTQKVQLPGIP